MKCISLWDPWATLCTLGLKRFETRGWETSHRGLLLIHAAKLWTGEQRRIVNSEPFRSALWSKMDIVKFSRGCIIGAVEVVGMFQVVQNQGEATPYLYDLDGDVGDAHFDDGDMPLPSEPERSFGDYAVGRFAWQLENPIRFAKPIPYRGLQKIFEVPDEIVAEQMKARAA